jgi:hypothetical protein
MYKKKSKKARNEYSKNLHDCRPRRSRQNMGDVTTTQKKNFKSRKDGLASGVLNLPPSPIHTEDRGATFYDWGLQISAKVFWDSKREIMVELLANLGRLGFGQNTSDK